MNSTANESLLILSDVHLGNDLNDVTPAGARRSALVDADLANLLAHYRSSPCAGKRWRLVIAGDFIDFVGMSLLPREEQLDDASEEERAHGLGNSADHVSAKLSAVVARHRIVFEALADFVAEGHGLTIVHGNHDVEFHWDPVKDQFRTLLVDIASRRRGWTTAATTQHFATRVEFAPWFYYVGGVAYVEHGHQYDTLCSTEHIMAPLSPSDPATHRAELLGRAPAVGRAPDARHPGVRPRADGRARLRLARRRPRASAASCASSCASSPPSWSSFACGARTSRRPRARCAPSTSDA